MNPLLLSPLLDFGKSFLDRLFPDKEKQAEGERALLALLADGSLKSVLAQLEINAREAAHPSIWVAGWRPFFGWVLGSLLLYHYMLREWLVWTFLVLAPNLPPPPTTSIDSALWELIFGLLGIAGLRSWEKARKVTK